MSLPPGQRLGAYEIVSLVGAGGMGEVYRARDTRLNRDVALKILPPRVAGSVDLLERFQREAQAVASLSHPNILAVHDIGTSDLASYAVFELLEGASLRERIESGPLPLRKAIDYGRQIADGLAAAHEKGITHRDIKPDNIFVTDDGRVKILDFGLAHRREQIDTPTETVTRGPLTDAGTILGTVGYMAPEQVRGAAADHRADIFAFGCVLYEMCTGTRAFEGASAADTMAAVLSTEPPDLKVSGSQPPPALDRIIRRCLEKQPVARFQSARDLSFALDALSSGSTASVLVAAPGPTRSMAWSILPAVLVGLLAGVGIAWTVWRPVPERPSPRLRAEFPVATGGLALSMSPDGTRLVYADLWPNGAIGLVMRDLGKGTVAPVPTSENAVPAGWSRRSDAFLFSSGTGLFAYRLGETTSTRLLASPSGFRGAAWLADDTIVFGGPSPGLHRMKLSGGQPTEIARSASLLAGPAAVGDRTDYVLALDNGVALNRRVVTVRLSDGTVGDVIANDGQAFYARGRLLLGGANGLSTVPFDAASGVATGAVESLDEQVPFDPVTGTVAAAASEAGVVAFRTGRLVTSQFEWIDKSGKSLGAVGTSDSYGSFALSPDGTKVVARRVGGNEARAIATSLVLVDLVRGVSSGIRTPEGAQSDPIWTPDGSQITYRSGMRLLRQSPVSTTVEEVRPNRLYPDAYSPDGKWLIAGEGPLSRAFQLFVVPSSGSGEPQPIGRGDATADEGSFSPNGKWISYQQSSSGRAEIYIARFPLTDERWQISANGGVQARWGDDDTLYFLALDGMLMRVSMPGGDPQRAGRPEPVFNLGVGTVSTSLEQYALAGDRILVLRPVANARQTIAVISNWTVSPQ